MASEAEVQKQESEQEAKPRVKRWTHRTKTGCMVCRKRRIKCDEERPHCKRCIIAGHNCPGYVGKVFPIREMSIAPAPARPTTSLPQPGEMHDSLDLPYLIPKLIEKQRGNGIFLNDYLTFAAARYAQHLPSLSGQHAPLDAAICCLAEGIREVLRTSHSKKSGATLLVDSNPRLTRLYLTAVASLRRSLDDCEPSTLSLLPLAAILICCYESLKERSEETVLWHMYGLSKIFEHRGIPNLGSEVEYAVMIGSIPLIVMSSYFSNTPCFLSQKRWFASLQKLKDIAPTDAQRGFANNWSDCAVGSTLLAECSQFILSVPATRPDWADKRRELLIQIKRLEDISLQERQEKVKELADDDPDADIYSVFEKLSKAKGGLRDYRLHFLTTIPKNQLLYYVLRIALGGAEALAAAKSAKELSEWLDAFEKRQPKELFQFSPILRGSVDAYLETSDAWQFFAREAEMAVAKGRPQVVDAKLFKRWLEVGRIKPRK